MDIYVFRGPNGYLIPADEKSRRTVDRLKPDEYLRVTVKKKRNGPHHRKFWALAQVIAENSDVYRNEDAAAAAMKIAAGHCDWIPSPITGELIPDTKSISYENMDQLQFAEFYERAIDGTIHFLLPTMNRISLEQAIDRALHFA